jgi:flavin reductase (DIM6/NTAB) family NADH-FMN oxidoreductase RutF
MEKNAESGRVDATLLWRGATDDGNQPMARNPDEVLVEKNVSEELESDFLGIMRASAQAVTLITSCDADGNPHGMAASSVISLSKSPPSMCISINRSASLHPVIDASSVFCINLLMAEQSDLIEAFSKSEFRDRRFGSSDWRRGPKNLPFLASARAAIFCMSDASIDYSTHTLHIGRVMEIKRLNEGLPLLWFDGAYAAIGQAIPNS